jgi:hypothetical protein
MSSPTIFRLDGVEPRIDRVRWRRYEPMRRQQVDQGPIANARSMRATVAGFCAAPQASLVALTSRAWPAPARNLLDAVLAQRPHAFFHRRALRRLGTAAGLDQPALARDDIISWMPARRRNPVWSQVSPPWLAWQTRRPSTAWRAVQRPAPAAGPAA